MTNEAENREGVAMGRILLGLTGCLFLLPYVVVSWLSFPFVTGKALAFRVVAECLVMVWLAALVQGRDARPRWGWILGMGSVFVVWVGLATGMGDNALGGFFGNYERMDGYGMLLHLYGVFLVAGASIRRKETWDRLLLCGVVASLGMVLAVAAEGRSFLPQGPEGRAIGTFGNPMYLAGYEVFIIFLGLYVAVSGGGMGEGWRKRGAQLLGVAGAVAGGVLLWMSNTRGSLLAVALGVVVAAVGAVVFLRKKDRVAAVMSGGVLVGMAAVVVVFFLFKDTGMVRGNPKMARIAEMSWAEGSGGVRWQVWQVAWEGAKEVPIFGWGMGNFAAAFDRYYVPELYGSEDWFDHAHNAFLDWLVVGGMPGAIAYFGIFVALVGGIVGSRKYAAREKCVLVGLVAAYGAHLFFAFDDLVSAVFFVLVLAMVHSQQGGEQKVCKGLSARWRRLGEVVAVGLVVGPWVVYRANVGDYRACRDISTVLRTGVAVGGLSGDARERVARGLVEKARGMAGGVPRVFFGEVPREGFEIRAQWLLETGFAVAEILPEGEVDEYFRFAFWEVEKWVDGSDCKTNYKMGGYWHRRGDFGKAGEYYGRAAEISPLRPGLLMAWAFNDWALGKREEAKAKVGRACELVGENGGGDAGEQIRKTGREIGRKK